MTAKRVARSRTLPAFEREGAPLAIEEEVGIAMRTSLQGINECL
jgi:hypothetical protein